MKIFFNKLALLSIFVGFTFLNSCDELNNLPLNIPIRVNFSTSGSDSQLIENQSFWLSNVQEWRDNQENINSANFVSAAYWTQSASPGLQGDINVALADENGNLLFSINIPNYKAADNLDTPYTLELSQNQIQALDDYLSTIGNDGNDHSFIASLTISNITGSSTPYSLTGRVEIVLEADVEL